MSEGPIGFQGCTGPPGASGSDFFVGDTGYSFQGPTGSEGVNTVVGCQGEVGNQGATGNNGSGTQGPQGTTGSSGKNLVLIGKYPLSGNTVQVKSVFSSTYDDYMILGTTLATSGTQQQNTIVFNFLSGTTPATDNNYYNCATTFIYPSTAGQQNAQQTFMEFSAPGATAEYYGFVIMDLQSPFKTERPTAQYRMLTRENGNVVFARIFQSAYNATTSFDGFQLTTVGFKNNTMGGNVWVYGYNK